MDNNLSLYRIFLATAKCGNISQAAAKLYISQPAVSKAIAKLESNVGTSLFIRTPKGVTLTSEGQVLNDNISKAFSYIENGEAMLEHIVKNGEGQLRIGASQTLCKHILLPYLRDFKEKYPLIQISVECEPTYGILNLLKEGKIDLGLIGRTNDSAGVPGEYQYTQVCEIQDVFVTTKEYLNSLKGKDILSEATLLMLDQDNMTRQYIDNYLYSNHIQIGKLIEATSMEMLIDFAKIGLGVACVIKQFVKEETEKGELVETPMHINIPRRSVGFVYSKESLPSEAAKKFVNAFLL